MPTYLTPGVYRAPQPAVQTGVAAVRTDVAGFVGYTERGPLPPPDADQTFHSDSVALKVTSWSEFQAIFGSFQDFGYLPFAVRGFFENGGTECYVVRVAAVKDANLNLRPATAALTLPSAEPDLSSGLTVDRIKGDTEVKVADGSGFRAGDAVQLSSQAMNVFSVVARVEGNSVLLVDPLLADFAAKDAVLERYPGSIQVTAKSAGRWGSQVWVSFFPLVSDESALRFAMRVSRPGQAWSVAEEEFYQKLSVDPADAFDDALYAPTVLAQSRLVSMTIPTGPVAPLRLRKGPLSTAQRLQGGRDGLAAVTRADFLGGPDDYRGLRLLEDIDDIAIVSIPDATFTQPTEPPPNPRLPDAPCAAPLPTLPDPATPVSSLPPTFDMSAMLDLQLSMMEHCNRMRYRMAILDPPPGLLPTEVAVWAESLRGMTGRFGALYYPWLHAPDPRSFDAPPITVPPSGHVAGIFARSDQLKGVRKPPANEPLDFLTDIAFEVDDDTQGDLNTARVNCIRALPGRGIRIWGARTLSAPADSSWMFVNVRRLMSFIEASIERSSRWAVFENNDDRLRRALVHSLNVFLRGIWESGGLQGNRPEEAYFVKCDATNNPASTIGSGQLICQVGVAVAVPMEFLVFEIRRNVDSAQVVEEEQSL